MFTKVVCYYFTFSVVICMNSNEYLAVVKCDFVSLKSDNTVTDKFISSLRITCVLQCKRTCGIFIKKRVDSDC